MGLMGGMGRRIIESTLANEPTNEPVQKHIKRKWMRESYHKRIQKKWTKRWGYRHKPVSYMVGNRTLICHPAIAAKLRSELGG